MLLEDMISELEMQGKPVALIRGATHIPSIDCVECTYEQKRLAGTDCVGCTYDWK